MGFTKEAFLNRVQHLIREKFGTDWGAQKEAAKAFGMLPGTLNHYFKRKSLPKADALQKIAKGLGVSADYLLTGESLDQIADRIAKASAPYGQPLTKEEKEIISLWRTASETGREIARFALQKDIKYRELPKKSATRA